MCQYSAVDGSASDWHTVHFSNMLQSGAGVFILEATGVEAAGRISHGCLGLYSDANEEALARVLKIVRPYLTSCSRYRVIDTCSRRSYKHHRTTEVFRKICRTY
jgi:2,4-dienoyl-CoA reductase-like NADH-dependent reductase (Old Yellow Enzyme family)